MIQRFLRWLLAPVLEAIAAQASWTYGESMKRFRELRESSDLIRHDIDRLPRYGDHLHALAISMTELRGVLNGMRFETPHMTLGLLMAWEAVAYASEKYDKDVEQHGVSNRVTEILAWASAYMHENEWAVPTGDVLTTLLTMRDQIATIRTCDKYS